MAAEKIVATGALRGLGLEVSRALAKKEDCVVLAGRNEQRGEEVRPEFVRAGWDAWLPFLDVADSKAIESFSRRVLQERGRVDVLVNNDGVLLDQPGQSASEEARVIEKTFATNALGPCLLCRSLVPQMVRNGFARVVNFSSGLGQFSKWQRDIPLTDSPRPRSTP